MLNSLRLGPALLIPLLLVLAGLFFLVSSAGLRQTPLLGVWEPPQTLLEGDSYPKLLSDSSGLVQILERPPQRIVSTILAGDEMLTALVAPSRLVGVSSFAADPMLSNCAALIPPHARQARAEAEAILSMEPDFVLAAGYIRSETIRFLAAVRTPVLRLSRFGSFVDIQNNLRLVARAVGAEERAEAIIKEMDLRMEQVRLRVSGRPRPRVLFYFPGGETLGGNTLLDEMIERAGGFNVARALNLERESRIPTELVIGIQPEVVLVAAWSPKPEDDPALQILHDPVWREVPAVKNRRVYSLREGWLTCVSQYAVKGVEELANVLHPDSRSAEK